MDDTKILIDICEAVFQRSLQNKASVPASTVKKDTPKLKKPRRFTPYAKHFKEAMSNKDFVDLLGDDKKNLIWKLARDSAYFIKNKIQSKESYRTAKTLYQFYKSPTYKSLVHNELVKNGVKFFWMDS